MPKKYPYIKNTFLGIEQNNGIILYDSNPLLHDVIAYWKFNNNADELVHGYTSTVTEVIWSSDVPSAGSIGSAEFTGATSSRIDLLDTSALNFDSDDQFSVSFWFARDNIGFSGLGYFFNKQAANGEGYSAFFETSFGRILFQLHGEINIVDYLEVVAITSGFTDQNWHHAVITYDGSKLASGVKIYTDGNNQTLGVDLDSLTGSTLNSTALTIGNSCSGEGHCVRGNIDELGFWNRVLTQEEVTDLYNGGQGLYY